mmetsp:Transcript_7317/g.15787  ORF Transcript_7317/g.15787 Transcript_7317/m.15787 type:complete len:238 (-) Transcript_7317:2460-3173(-)
MLDGELVKEVAPQEDLLCPEDNPLEQHTSQVDIDVSLNARVQRAPIQGCVDPNRREDDERGKDLSTTEEGPRTAIFGAKHCPPGGETQVHVFGQGEMPCHLRDTPLVTLGLGVPIPVVLHQVVTDQSGNGHCAERSKIVDHGLGSGVHILGHSVNGPVPQLRNKSEGQGVIGLGVIALQRVVESVRVAPHDLVHLDEETSIGKVPICVQRARIYQSSTVQLLVERSFNVGKVGSAEK